MVVMGRGGLVRSRSASFSERLHACRVRCSAWFGGPFVLDVQYAKLLGILPALRPSQQANDPVHSVRADLVPADEGEDVVVVAGDYPPPTILQRDRAEVAERRPSVNRAVLPEQGGGLGGQVGLRLHEDDAGAVLEQHPRLVGAIDCGSQYLDQVVTFHRQALRCRTIYSISPYIT